MIGILFLKEPKIRFSINFALIIFKIRLFVVSSDCKCLRLGRIIGKKRENDRIMTVEKIFIKSNFFFETEKNKKFYNADFLIDNFCVISFFPISMKNPKEIETKTIKSKNVIQKVSKGRNSLIFVSI